MPNKTEYTRVKMTKFAATKLRNYRDDNDCKNISDAVLRALHSGEHADAVNMALDWADQSNQKLINSFNKEREERKKKIATLERVYLSNLELIKRMNNEYSNLVNKSHVKDKKLEASRQRELTYIATIVVGALVGLTVWMG